MTSHSSPQNMVHAGAVRSSALGTRIAAVSPPPFAAVPETIPVAPAAHTWDWTQPESAPRATVVSKTSRTTRRTKSTRPTSAPLRKRPGSGCGGTTALDVSQESKHHRKATPAHQRQAVELNDEAPGTKTVVMTARVRVGKRRARPASAQPSSRAPASPSPASTGGFTGTSRRLSYRAKRLPPPWDDNSSAGRSLEPGGAGGCCRSAGRRRARPGASTPTEALNFGGGVRNDRDWDDCGTVRLGPAARKAVAAKAAAAERAKSEAASRAAAPAAVPPWMSPERARARGGAAGAGRPYMSRAERAAEESKEIKKLREEVELWRGEAGAARAEAVDARKRLESQEESVAAVLHQTAEVLPTYRYGLDLTAAVASSRPHGASREPPQLAILEHRRELEKSLVVRRLRGQMSRLTERLAAAEGELAQLKRSCQFTALAEMLSAGEEYANEVERLRASLGDDKCHSPATGFPSGKTVCGSLRPRVVDIPSATNSKPKPLMERPSSRGGGSTQTRSNSGDDIDIAVSPTGESVNQGHGPEQDVHHCSSPDVDGPFTRSARAEEEQQPKDEDNMDDYPHPRERPHQQQRQRYGKNPSTGERQRTNGGGRGRRRSRHGGETLVSSRARAGLLGVPAPGGGRGYLTIDEPIATVSSGRAGSSGVGGNARVDARESGGETGVSGKGGRVGVTTEMEIDVMKGLVLAQHQRIERQRSRMQELERDLRDYRRAAMAGGQWPETRWGGQPSSPAWKGGLTPSRSAPAGLDRLTGVRAALSRFHADQNRGSVRGSSAASPPSRRADRSRSRVFSPESLRRRGERSSGLGATLVGNDGNDHHNNRSSSGPDGKPDPRPGFMSCARPMFPSSSAPLYSAAASIGGGSSSRRRPWTATAAGRTRAEAWRNADVRDGFGTHPSSGRGVGAANKRRPRSASSRFHTSPGRERARSKAQAAGEESVGGVPAKMGPKVDGAKGLPEGWAEAVDEESGHVYYYSDKRSTWVRPSVPASPRTPYDDSNDCGDIVGTLPGVGGDDPAAPVPANLVAAAIDLAGSLLQAAEAADSEEGQTEEGQEKSGRSDHPGGGKTATDARRNEVAPDSAAVDSESSAAAAAAAAAAGQGRGRAEQRHSSSTLLQRPAAKLEQAGSDGFPGVMDGHGGRPQDRTAANGPTLLEDDENPLHPLSVSLPAGSGRDSGTQSEQLQLGGEVASAEPALFHRHETEPSTPPKHHVASEKRSSDAQGEALQAARPEHDGRKAVATSEKYSVVEQKKDEVAGSEDGTHSASGRIDELSPQQAGGPSETFPGVGALIPTSLAASKTASATPRHSHNRDEGRDTDSDRSSRGREVSGSVEPRLSRSSGVINGGAAPPSMAEKHVPLASTRPLLSQEETENAMAALIARLRQPAADCSISEDDPPTTNAAVALPDDVAANGRTADHSLDAHPRIPATESGVERKHALEQGEETDGLGNEDGEGAVAESLETKASEAAEGMYEDDFDDD